MTTTFAIRRTNPKSVWPFRIVRITAEIGRTTRTHKLLIKFRTAEAAQAWLDKNATQIDRIA